MATTSITGSPTRKNTQCAHREREADELFFWRTILELSPRKNPSQTCQDLQGAFVGTYWSSSVLRSLEEYIRVYHWHAPTSNAMDASRDALCLLHLGTRYQDRRLLLEGDTRYSVALQCLRSEIQRPGAVNNDSLLGACYTIAQCEVYRVISGENDGGWTTHIPHLLTVFQKRGASSIKSPFARAVLHNTKTVTAMYGILKRKRVLFSSPDWSRPGDAYSRSKPAMRLTHILLQVAELLERTDELHTCPNEDNEAEIVSTLTSLMEVERQVQQWLLDFYESTGGEAMPYKEVNLAHYPSFKERCGTIADVFPTAIEFPTFLSATSHLYVWITLLTIRQAIVDVAGLHPYPLVRPINQDALLVAAVEEVASNLCRCLPFVTQREHSSAGLLACGGPLYFAGAWYKARQDVRRATWCETVREFLQRDALAGGSYETSINLQQPLLTWWMLPDIFKQPKELVRTARRQ
ncbi:hypothetical protein LTS10_003088 [Elasticomyces elasticus]|nr:hypothetical protein LTS10_003088 [Elasticomyces elasticus]